MSFGPLLCERLRDQRCNRYLRGRWITVVLCEIGVGQLLGLDHEVQGAHAVLAIRRYRKAPMILSMESAAMPIELGGSSETVQPRYVVEIGSTHSG